MENKVVQHTYSGYELIYSKDLSEIELLEKEGTIASEIALLIPSKNEEFHAYAMEVISKCSAYFEKGFEVKAGHTITVDSLTTEFPKSFLFLIPTETHLLKAWGELSEKNLLILFPLFESEMELLKHKGLKRFYKLLERSGHTSMFNPNRAPIKAKKFLGIF